MEKKYEMHSFFTFCLSFFVCLKEREVDREIGNCTNANGTDNVHRCARAQKKSFINKRRETERNKCKNETCVVRASKWNDMKLNAEVFRLKCEMYTHAHTYMCIYRYHCSCLVGFLFSFAGYCTWWKGCVCVCIENIHFHWVLLRESLIKRKIIKE